ncbi:putative spt2 chromatin protein [Phaeoacremonium minimum UCRPA7]|uniref:Putative spt2 chromatin protein n=1 Tax=Phaeoacremonium minimum (strain UCR-PA7) TaxID=1286976 RepID=R8BES4_PHAM7|nr:putative spt2 chromatin protein [Phaeoacremonium minimum UCRPA7]EON97795.1 putative spt2 chromatin protein [Phaeoacremonium minimum UCRPA7]
MGAVGKIQHKALDKVPTKREREELKAEQTKGLRRGAKPQNTKPGHARLGANGSGASRDGDLDRPRGGTSSMTRRKDGGKSLNGKTAKSVEEDKKLKKAATATTGYTGTARPPPGASRAGSSSKPTAPNGSRDRHHESRPYGAFSARRNRDDDYDEELDDFIEYDDDEPEYGGDRRRGYGDYSDEDDESDMEAGLSDIDVEERRAEIYARQEDRREEALERKLKLEKEERKRRLLEGR